MTDLIDFVRFLTAPASLLAALAGLSKALEQRSKRNEKGLRR